MLGNQRLEKKFLPSKSSHSCGERGKSLCGDAPNDTITPSKKADLHNSVKMGRGDYAMVTHPTGYVDLYSTQTRSPNSYR